MKKNVKELLFLGGASAAAYFFFFRMTRKQADAIFLAHFKKSTNPSWDDGYVIGWAKAIKNKKGTFKFNGKSYSALTGRAI